MGAGAGSASPADHAIDLRRAPLAALREIRFRDESRDLAADEAALWDRLTAAWAGLDDAAWRLPGAAPSDAGGPPWSLLDHVAHVVDWLEIAAAYIERVLQGGAWPDDADYDGGDFDRYNEGRRAPWSAIAPAEIRRRGGEARARVLRLVAALPPGTVRSHEAWSWIFMVLHGHDLDHLVVIEPWAEQLRRRQADGDPFGSDPYGTEPGPEATAGFVDAAITTLAAFDEALIAIPDADWERLEASPGWSVKDHAGHVAAWLEEADGALAEHDRTGTWRTYDETEDEWNARAVAEWASVPPAEVRARLLAAHERVLDRARALEPAILWSYDGLGWTYEVLHGHVRRHLALVGPIAARAGWPAG